MGGGGREWSTSAQARMPAADAGYSRGPFSRVLCKGTEQGSEVQPAGTAAVRLDALRAVTLPSPLATSGPVGSSRTRRARSAQSMHAQACPPAELFSTGKPPLESFVQEKSAEQRATWQRARIPV